MFFPELLTSRAGLGDSLFPERPRQTQTHEVSPGQEVRRLKMSSWDVTASEGWLLCSAPALQGSGAALGAAGQRNEPESDSPSGPSQ